MWFQLVYDSGDSVGKLDCKTVSVPSSFHGSYNAIVLGRITPASTYAFLLYTLYRLKYMATCTQFIYMMGRCYYFVIVHGEGWTC